MHYGVQRSVSGLFRSSIYGRFCLARGTRSINSEKQKSDKRKGTDWEEYAEADCEYEHRSTGHRFEKLHDWKGPTGLAKHLMENIIYQDEDILVFNKPSGVPMHELQYEESGADHPEDIVSVHIAMGMIRDWMKLDYVKNVYSQPRLYSGIVIFTKRPEASDFLKKYYVYTQKSKIKHQKYRLIACGVPQDVDSNVVFPVWREPTEYGDLFYKAVKTQKKFFQRRSATKFEMEFRSLKQANIGQSQVSYIEAQSYLSKWHSLELCMTQHQQCPILGDHLFSHRLHTVQGKKVLMRPDLAPVSREQQRLELDIAKALKLRSETDTDCLPLHVHCCAVRIPANLRTKLHQSQKLITFKAPLPDYFSKSLEELKLTTRNDNT